MSTTINVSTAAELDAALASASGGETILLAPGSYGELRLTGENFSDYVTIKSADPDNPAEFGFARVQDSSYLRLEGLDFSGVGVTGGTGAVIITNNHHIQFYNNHIEGGDTGLKVGGVTNLEVVGNTVDKVGEQSYKFWGVHDFLIENNFGARDHFPEPQSHMDFIQFAGSSSNGVVRGNVFLPTYSGSKIIQGVFLDNGSYSNITIEQNLIYTTAVNGIGTGATFVGSNVIAQHNTVLTIPGYGYHTTYVTLPGEGNISNAGGQLNLQYTDPNAPNYYNSVYQNATVGLGATIEDFRPVPGGPADFGSGLGAEQRIAELLAEGGGTPGNTIPDTNDDTASTGEDTAVTISADDLLSNDSDADGDTLTIISVSGGTNGSAVLNADGTITFLPNVNFNGTASFTYTAADGNGGLSTSTVTIDVGSAPDAPGAVDDTLSIDSIAPVVVDVLDNDADPDGDDLEVTSVTQGANGSVAINADGTLTYTPFPWLFQGTDEFSYTISDGNGGTSTATVTIAPFPTPVLDLSGEHEFGGGNGDVINLQHDASLELSEATIAFSFSADSVVGRLGLLAKDAAGFTGGGNHLAIYIENGVLVARFQDGLIESTITHGVLNPGEEYEVAATFGPNGVELFVDGVSVGADTGLNMSWVSNQEYLQIGGLGWGSQTGQGDFADPFSGDISNVQIYDRVLDGSQIEELASDAITGTSNDDILVGTGEEDEIVGDDGDDTLYGLGNTDSLIGGAGSDSLWGGTGNDLLQGGDDADILRGEAGNDFLLGGEGNDALAGHAGADTLFGDAGNDFLYGNQDDDALWGGTGDDVLKGDEGNDVLRGEAGNDYLHGGEGNDALAGHQGADVLIGGAGNDFLYGNGDDDRLWGGTGNDVLKGEDGADVLRGEDGHDYIDGGDGDDALAGHAGNDVLIGGAGNDFMYGNGGDDNLSGGTGNDVLKGESGDDVLNGGAGDDYLEGGIGNDTFVFAPGDGNDTLADFTAGAGSEDVIDVSAFTHSSLSDILSVASQDSTDVVIDLDGGTSVRLLGVNLADLHEDDFLFA